MRRIRTVPPASDPAVTAADLGVNDHACGVAIAAQLEAHREADAAEDRPGRREVEVPVAEGVASPPGRWRGRRC